MAVIYCPQCDSEIPKDTAVCPSCGFNLDSYIDEDDTDNEFNALLNAANKKLSEEAEEADDEEEEEESGEIDGNSTFTQSQIDALLGGGVVDLTDEKKPAAKKKSNKPKAVKREMPPAKKLEAPPEPEPASAPAEEAAESAPAEPVTIPPVQGIRPEDRKKPEKKGAPVLVTVLAVVVAAALGFCVSLLLFGDIFRTQEEAFAVRAANAVNSTLDVNEQLCVYKAYVKLGAAADECIIYAITDYKDVVSAAKYRVVVNKNDNKVVNVYYTVDENSPEYLAMKESDDPEVRVQASVLKNYSDTIESAHREISIGTPGWVSVDISKINSSIKPIQTKTINE